MSSQPPQAIYDMKAIAEHVLHSKRRQGEDTSDARMFLGAVTAAIGATMFYNAFMAKRNGEQTTKTWANRTSHSALIPRELG